MGLSHIDTVGISPFPVSSSQSCGRLEQEKEDLRAAFDGVLQKMQEQHRSDLADLEEKLRTFYAAEWDKVHQVYQEEADKCKAQMEEQVRRGGDDDYLPLPLGPVRTGV